MTLSPVQGRRAAVPRDQKPRRRSFELSCLAALAGLLWLGAALLYHQTRPNFGPATLLLPGATPRQFDYPFLLLKAPRTKFVLQQQLQLPRLHPTVFVFYPHDFLWAVNVNGHHVRAPGLPLSGASLEGRSIDLAPFLHLGANVIALQMEARWGEASLRIGVSPWDKYSLVLLAMIACATCATAAFLCALFRVSGFQPEAIIILAGIVLRYIYFFGTPWFVRSLDYWGHADYLDYIVQHLSLPPPNANWEAFQPPLYYIVAGGVTKLLLLLGMPEEQRYVLWQGISLVFSMALLLIAWFITRNLYENEPGKRFYMLAVLAVAPPLVFNAARVSNDGLVSLLAFLWLALLLCYWRKPAKITWIWLSVVTGLALLTKANALAFVIISVLCLSIDKRLAMRSRITRFAALLAVCCAIAGWYYLPRALHATAVNTYVVGNLISLNYHGRIDGVFLKSLIFNPVKVIRYPFVEIWGPRNDHFPEVFFKTIFLGEWIKGASYKFLARTMMIIALLLIPPFAVGLYQALRQRAVGEGPLLFTLAGVFLAQWLFLQAAPYLSTQDFRYSVILLVPITHYFLKGLDIEIPRWKSIATFALQLALINSAIYLVTLALGD